MTHYDVAVVGGGPAGLATARVAAANGARTVLIDEGDQPGGQLRYRIGQARIDSDEMPGLHAASALVDQAQRAGVLVFSGAIVWGAYPGIALGVTGLPGSAEIRADRLVLATGSTDRALSFPGSDLPGVMTGGGLLRMLHLHRVWPGGKRVAIVGDDSMADEVARSVEMAGGVVSGRVLKHPVVSAANGVVTNVRDGAHEFETDLVAICAGCQPDIGLALMLECETGYAAALGGFTPTRSRTLETTVAGVFVCGGAAGNGTPEEHLAEGELAGLAAAVSLNMVADQTLDEAVQEFDRRFPGRVAAAAGITTSWRQHFVESVRAEGGV